MVVVIVAANELATRFTRDLGSLNRVTELLCTNTVALILSFYVIPSVKTVGENVVSIVVRTVITVTGAKEDADNHGERAKNKER